MDKSPSRERIMDSVGNHRVRVVDGTTRTSLRVLFNAGKPRVRIKTWTLVVIKPVRVPVGTLRPNLLVLIKVGVTRVRSKMVTLEVIKPVRVPDGTPKPSHLV